MRNRFSASKFFRKTAVCIVVGALLLSATACMSGGTPNDGVYKSGAYEASAQGFGGEVTVKITIDKGKITSVTAEGPEETTGVGSRAIEQLPARILKAGSADVDGVSGASISSAAVLKAAEDALAKAKGESREVAVVKMAPGTYTGEGDGYAWIGKLTMDVTVDETEILNITVRDKGRESSTIFKSVMNLMVPRIIKNQSLAVDSITGATASSAGVKGAVAAALTKALKAAGTDPSALERFYAPVAKSTAVENIHVDVVVVGMGAAGCSAAMSAAEAQKAAGMDVSVLAIDKAGKYGGTAEFCGSPMGVNPKRFKAEFNGGKDYVDAEAFRKDWREYAMGDSKDEIVDLFIDESGNTIDWLMYDHGFVFNQPRSEVADFRVCMDYAFNGRLEKGRDYGREFGNRLDSAHSYFNSIVEDYTKLGGKYMLETEGYDLIYNKQDNTVAGIKARNIDGTEYVINADVVILATGGFGGNDEMEKKYLGAAWPHFGMMQNDGKMIDAAIKIGAGTYNIDMVPVSHYNTIETIMTAYPVNIIEGKVDSRWGYPAVWSLNDVPLIMAINPDCLWVTTKGERFVNEGGFHVSWKGGPKYYSIWSGNQVQSIKEKGFSVVTTTRGFGQGGVPKNRPIPEMDEILEKGIEMGIIDKAESLDALAKKLGMDPAILETTVQKYNEACQTGKDTGFGKKAEYLRTMGEEGPFYAFHAVNLEYGTCGALDIDRDLNVLLLDKKTKIKGLYATGYDSSGVLYTDKKSYVDYGGAALGWSFTSGRLAGKNGVAYIASGK